MPAVTSEAITRLLNMALPRLARFQAVLRFLKSSPCGMKLKGVWFTCCTVWLAPANTTMKGPIRSRSPATMTT
ncbi:hypothetical protein D3C71_2122150 [compost metagenome]